MQPDELKPQAVSIADLLWCISRFGENKGHWNLRVRFRCWHSGSLTLLCPVNFAVSRLFGSIKIQVDEVRAGPPEDRVTSLAHFLVRNSNTMCMRLAKVCQQRNGNKTNKKMEHWPESVTTMYVKCMVWTTGLRRQGHWNWKYSMHWRDGGIVYVLPTLLSHLHQDHAFAPALLQMGT